MGDFLSEIRDLEVDALLRIRPLFAAAQPYQQEGGASSLYLRTLCARACCPEA